MTPRSPDDKDAFERSLKNVAVDRSSADAFAKSIEDALLGVGLDLPDDPTQELYDAPPVITVVAPKDLHKIINRRLFPTRMKVITRRRLVKLPTAVLDFEDDVIDFDKVTDEFIEIHDKAAKELTHILTETLAYKQALRHVVERFQSQEAFADLGHNSAMLTQMLNLRVVTQLAEALKLNKDDAIAMILKKEDKR
jgi:hypothetical protein